jgi:copper chaperone CopZ
MGTMTGAEGNCPHTRTGTSSTLGSGTIGKDNAYDDDDDDMDVTKKSCIALLPETGNDIIMVYDTNSDVKYYSCSTTKNKNVTVRNLCFSTHGHNVGDLLTPCLDDEGIHGDPPEGCFCGIDTPHLHAHLFDPKTCGEEEDGNGSTPGNEKELMRLARLTLHPVTSMIASDPDGLGIVHISSHDHAPHICKSRDYVPVEQGRQPPSSITVRHGDHWDELIHHEPSGECHLEHLCDDCGQRDWHGTFKPVVSREWGGSGRQIQLRFYDLAKQTTIESLDVFPTDSMGVDRIRDCDCPGACINQRSSCTRLNEQDSQVATEAVPTSARCSRDDNNDAKKSDQCRSKGCCKAVLNKLDLVQETKSCCANKNDSWPTVDDIETATCCSDEEACPHPCCATGVCLANTMARGGDAGSDGVVRSTFFCSKICCASEIPSINSVLTSVEGISRVLVNVPLRKVIVDHYCSVVPADRIETILNDNAFGARIERDGAASKGNRNEMGRSRFFVDKICCASEIPAIRTIVEPLVGVTSVRVNVTTKTVCDALLCYVLDSSSKGCCYSYSALRFIILQI